MVPKTISMTTEVLSQPDRETPIKHPAGITEAMMSFTKGGLILDRWILHFDVYLLPWIFFSKLSQISFLCDEQNPESCCTRSRKSSCIEMANMRAPHSNQQSLIKLSVYGYNIFDQLAVLLPL